MKNKLLITLFSLTVTLSISQTVGIGTDSPSLNAALDIYSDTQGLLVPRITTANRLSISSPETSLLVFDTDLNKFFYFDGVNWIDIKSGNQSFINDSDNDTKIMVESGVDDDTIRFEISGQGRFKFNQSRITPLNVSKSILIGQDAGKNLSFEGYLNDKFSIFKYSLILKLIFLSNFSFCKFSILSDSISFISLSIKSIDTWKIFMYDKAVTIPLKAGINLIVAAVSRAKVGKCCV